MTTIERDRFTQAMSARVGRVDLQSEGSPVFREALAAAQVTVADISPAAGADHVLEGTTEFGALYEKLVELDRQEALTRGASSLDRAAAFLSALEREPAAPGAPTPGTRAPGIGRAPRRENVTAPETPTVGDGGTGPRTGAQATALTPTDPATPPLVATPYRHTVGEGRGAQEVATFVRSDPAVDAEVTRLRALESPPRQRGQERLPSVDSYLDAVEAYESGTDRTRRRPAGVSGDTWALARALHLEQISSQDVRHYLATNTLPDRLDAEGQILETGADRLARLERAATQRGSWTAVNSFTFLVGMQRSALASERQVMQSNLEALPEGAPERAGLQEAINRSTQLGRDLKSGLNGIYSAATYARERTSRGLVTSADSLETQARQLRSSSTPNVARAEALEARAQTLRDQGARMAFAEGDYRAGMRGTGWNAGTTYRVAAQAQISRGNAEVAALQRTQPGEPLPEQAPAVFGDTTATQTPNQVPGAGTLLGRARETDAGASRDHQQLALEGARQGGLAAFHRLHVDRSNYHDRVRPGTLQLLPDRTGSIVAHRRAYLEARDGQLRAADTRAELYGPVAGLSGPTAVEAQRVEGQRTEIRGELDGILATALASDRQVVEQREATDAARGELRDARQGTRLARSGFGESVESEGDARRGSGLTDIGKTAGERRRDVAGMSDAQVATEQSRVTLELAGQREIRAETAVNLAPTLELDVARQATRDRQDAELVRTVLARRSQGPAPLTISAAYDTNRAAGLASADRRVQLVLQAERTTSAADLNDETRADLARARVEVANHLTGSVDNQLRARGDRSGAEATLSRAGTLLGESDAVRNQMARGAERLNVGTSTLYARTALGESWADYRPGESRNQIRAAEQILTGELAFGPDDERAIRQAGGDQEAVTTARLDRQATRALAQDRIGSASVNALARRDQRFSQIAASGQHQWGVADELYRTAHRMFDGRVAAGPDGTSGRQLLTRIDRNLAEVPAMLESASIQIENGQAFGAAQTRTMGRADIQLAQSQVSSLISGPAWLFTAGRFDMKEQMADAGTEVANRNVSSGEGQTRNLTRGAGELGDAWRTAVASDRRFDVLDSIRILGSEDLYSANRFNDTSAGARTYREAHATLAGLVPAGARARGDYQSFLTQAVRGTRPIEAPADSPPMRVPVARALAGSVFGLADAHQTLGDRRLGVMTAGHVDYMIQPQIDQLNDTKKGQWRAWVNLGGEVVVGLIATGGAGSVRAVAGAAQAGNLARTGVQAANAVRLSGMMANAARTAGHTLAVGGALMGANMAVGYVFGRNSTAARTFEVGTNFIPASVMQRVSGFGKVVGGAEQNLSRMAQLRQVLTVSGVAAAQTVGTAIVVHEAAERGWVRSELGQMALGLGLNTMLGAGMGAYAARANRVQQARAMAAGLAEHLGPDGASPALTRALARDVDAFLRANGNAVPNEAQLGGLRTSLYAHLGAGDNIPDSPTRTARREAIDSFVESMRVQRAVTEAYHRTTDDGRRPISRQSVELAVQTAGEQLFEARGGEGRASRSQAYRDAALALATGLEADARAIEARSPNSADAALLREGQIWARDRMIASDLANGLTAPGPEGRPVITEGQRPRVEAVLVRELATAGEGPNARPLAERSQQPAFWDGVAARLVEESGVSRETARSIVSAAERDLSERGLIQSSNDLVVSRLLGGGQRATPGDVALLDTPGFRDLAASRPEAARAMLEAHRSGELDIPQLVREHGPQAVENLARLHQQSPAGVSRLLRIHGEDAVAHAAGADPVRLAAEAQTGLEAHQRLVDPDGSLQFRPLSGAEASQILGLAQFVQHVPGSSSPQLSAEGLRAMGVEPRWQLQIDGQRIALSDAFALPGGRQGMVALVEHDGQAHARMLYRSNSQSAWRVSDASRAGHFGKGMAEVDTMLPIDLTIAAHRMASDGLATLRDPATRTPGANQADLGMHVFHGLVENFGDGLQNGRIRLHAEGNAVHYWSAAYEASRGPGVSAGGHGAEIATDLAPVPRPEEIHLPPPEQLPDFTQRPEREFTFRSSAYGNEVVGGSGELTGRVYRSRDGSMRYLLVEDQAGRVGVVGAERTNSPLTSYGNRREHVALHGMDAPLFEYALQMSPDHGGQAGVSDYRLNWAYVRETPLVREFYRQRGLPAPEVLPEASLPADAPNAARLSALPDHPRRAIGALLSPNVDLGVPRDVAAQARDRMRNFVQQHGEEGARFLVDVGDQIGPRALAEVFASDRAPTGPGRQAMTTAALVEIRRRPVERRAQAFLAEFGQTRPSAPPRSSGAQAPRPVPNEQAVRAGHFADAFVAAGPGRNRSQAAQLFELATGTRRDPVTRLGPAADFAPTLDRAIDRVRSTGEPIHVVQASFRNLAGMNERLGHHGADQVYFEISAILREELASTGAQVSGFRGGPDMQFVLSGAEVPPAALDAAIARAEQRIAQRVQHHGLGDVDHPKHRGEAAWRGVGLSIASTQLFPGDSGALVSDTLNARIERLNVGLGQVRPAASHTPAPTVATREVPVPTDGPAPRVPSRPAGAPAFVDQVEVRRQAFIEQARSFGVGEPEARQLFDRAGGAETDPVTGFARAEDRVPTMERALDHLNRTKENTFYVEIDIRNLGGLTNAVGRAAADRDFGAAAHLIRQELRAVGADVALVRHGGDEVSAIVVAPGVEHAQIDAALTRAQERYAQYISDRGLANLPHPKAPNDPGRRGVGFIFGVEQAGRNDTPGSVFSRADQVVEQRKRGVDVQ